MTRRTLLLFTECYPFRNYTEEVFVKPDIDALSREFDQVVLLPLIRKDAMGHIDIPNVIVDTTLADDTGIQNRWMKRLWLLHPFTLKHLISAFRDSDTPNNNVLRNIAAYSNVAYISRILRPVLRRYEAKASSVTAYTFWFDSVTSALAILSPHHPELRIVSRAHGYDIYDNIHSAPHPATLRNMTLGNICGVFAASKTGADYLCQRFPRHKDRIRTSFLGSSKPDNTVNAGHSAGDNVITFLSVARVEPVKRIDRNLALVTEIAKRHPELKINWIHVGDGSLLNDLKTHLSDLPDNLYVEFRGNLDNAQVHAIYREIPIDWTILLSDSEGAPITICESLSYSIPPIATAVGGTPEIVNSSNGILVDVNMPSGKVADMINRFIDDRQAYMQLKHNALRTWQSDYQEGDLRKKFVRILSSLTC